MISETRPRALRCGTAPSEKPVKLDAVRAHDHGAANLEIGGEIEHGAAIDDCTPRIRRR